MDARRRSSATAQLAPELPDRYRSLRLLANGGMSSVWCAEDTALDRRVAIKLLSEGLIDDDRAKRRFIREARTAARLSGHPHVVTTYDVGHWDELPYIVMEHLAGGTVADAIRVGACSHSEALRWIEQAASALDHAHGRGVLHRDVKPANMVLGSDRVLHLADFGIASIVTEQTLSGTGQLMGTAAYLSPEQARGLPATAASDRYALAVAAFELLTGSRPFPGQNFAAQALAHIEDPPPPASERAALPPAVDDVLGRGLAKQPDERWPTAQSFARALREAVTAQHSTAATAVLAAVAPAARAAAVSTGGAAPVVREPPPHLIFESVASAGVGRRHGRRLALTALALVALALGIVVGASTSGGSHRSRSSLSASAVKLAAPKVTRPHHTARPKPAPAPPPTSPAMAATPPSATTLEAQGHELMNAGSYAAALPVLREALASAAPGTLTYAYALYDLGRTLRLSGDPGAAIPILEQRLQIPDQPAVVRQELNLAERAVATRTSASASTPNTTTSTPPTSGGAALPAVPPHAHGHGHAPHGHDKLHPAQSNAQDIQSD